MISESARRSHSGRPAIATANPATTPSAAPIAPSTRPCASTIRRTSRGLPPLRGDEAELAHLAPRADRERGAGEQHDLEQPERDDERDERERAQRVDGHRVVGRRTG